MISVKDERVTASNGGSSTGGKVILVIVKDVFYLEVNYHQIGH